MQKIIRTVSFNLRKILKGEKSSTCSGSDRTGLKEDKLQSVCYFPQPSGPDRAHFRGDQARLLAQMEEPSHCRRLATATQSIRSSALLQRPSRNQCHWRITRTSTNQFPVSWNLVGGLEEERWGGLKELHSGAAHDMSKRGDSGPFGSAVRDGSGGFHLRQR